MLHLVYNHISSNARLKQKLDRRITTASAHLLVACCSMPQLPVWLRVLGAVLMCSIAPTFLESKPTWVAILSLGAALGLIYGAEDGIGLFTVVALSNAGSDIFTVGISWQDAFRIIVIYELGRLFVLVSVWLNGDSDNCAVDVMKKFKTACVAQGLVFFIHTPFAWVVAVTVFLLPLLELTVQQQMAPAPLVSSPKGYLRSRSQRIRRPPQRFGF